MSLSVLTVVKNRRAHLLKLIEGLTRSKSAIETLIVVDMSDRIMPMPATPFSIVVTPMQGEGLPLSGARNRAAAEANSDHLLFLDVDCIPMASLAGEIDAVLLQSDALVCAPILYLGPADARGNWTEEQLFTSGTPHPARRFPRSGIDEEPNAALFWSLAFGIRRRSFEVIGGFDEDFVGYGAEDTDFGFRACEAGLPLLFKGGAGAFHQHHAKHEPPLQHFDDIVSNATVFRDKWGSPADGRLARLVRTDGPHRAERRKHHSSSPSDKAGNRGQQDCPRGSLLGIVLTRS